MPPIILLDGGTGHLLKREGGLRIDGLPYDQQFLAGAVANAEHPNAVERAHALYAAAGADVLTTNSFAAAPRALRLLPGGVRARLWRRLVSQYEEEEEEDALRLSAALAGEAARVARRAADMAAGAAPLVAGSLPPLGESCYAAPGSAPPPARAEAARQYLALARAMRPAADLLLAETLPTSDEALAALDAAAALAAAEEEEDEEGKGGEGREGGGGGALEIWVSFTVRDEGGEADGEAGLVPPPPPRLRGGEDLEAAVRRVLAHPAAAAAASPTKKQLLTAVLVNCCAPAAASAALPVLVRCCSGAGASADHGSAAAVRVGAYANGFRGTTSEWLSREARDDEGLERAARWAETMHRGRGGDFEREEGDGGGDDPGDSIITPEAYARYAAEWRRLGASIVGGCCGVGPRHVARLAADLRN